MDSINEQVNDYALPLVTLNQKETYVQYAINLTYQTQLIHVAVSQLKNL